MGLVVHLHVNSKEVKYSKIRQSSRKYLSIEFKTPSFLIQYFATQW